LKLKEVDNEWIEIISEFLKEITHKEDVLVIECSYELIQTAYEKISKTTDDLLNDSYDDKHLLYNLTPGNKNISIALALNSIRGNRSSCYIHQSGNKKGSIEYEELDVFHLKDIFLELKD
jgi:CRISPR/Cas system-associated protein Csm6